MLSYGRVEDLVGEQGAHSIEVVCDGVLGDEVPIVKRYAMRIIQRGSRCLIMLPGQEVLEEVLSAVRNARGRLVSVVPHKGSLEEVFVEQSVQRG